MTCTKAIGLNEFWIYFEAVRIRYVLYEREKEGVIFGWNNWKGEVLLTTVTGEEDRMSMARKLIAPLIHGSKKNN